MTPSVQLELVPASAAPSGPPPAVSSTLRDRPVLGARWDFLLLGPGATLVLTAAFLGLHRLGGEDAAAALATMLSLLVVGPHYAATYRRAYASRDIVRTHPWVTLAVPIPLLAVAVAAARSSLGGPLWALLYVAWSGFHYSRQSLGLAMLFPLRQGARLDTREKRLVALPLYVSWVVSLLGLFRFDVPARNPAYEIVRSTLLLPITLPVWLVPAALGVLLASLGGVMVVASERRGRGQPLPMASYSVIAAQIMWFVGGLYSPLFNVVLVPVFHGLQYLALTSWNHMRSSDAPTTRAFAAYVGGVLLLGLIINPGLPALAARLGSPSGVPALGTLAALISAINLHHFLLDGRIWRMRERSVARAFEG